MECPFARELSKFQSTLPVRGATQEGNTPGGNQDISIHAPREGSDLTTKSATLPRKVISIHAPREGSDVVLVSIVTPEANFNPRSP